jgi:putative FmdB family regulatory protein
MPLYEYECESCGQRFERIQKFSDPPVEKCPSCEGNVHKLLSSPAIQFKGSGWYITDYAKKGSSKGGSDKAASGGADTSGKSETKESSASSEKSDKADKSASSSSAKTD